MKTSALILFSGIIGCLHRGRWIVDVFCKALVDNVHICRQNAIVGYSRIFARNKTALCH